MSSVASDDGKLKKHRSCAPCAFKKRSCDHKQPCGRCTSLGIQSQCVILHDRRTETRRPAMDSVSLQYTAAAVAAAAGLLEAVVRGRPAALGGSGQPHPDGSPYPSAQTAYPEESGAAASPHDATSAEPAPKRRRQGGGSSTSVSSRSSSEPGPSAADVFTRLAAMPATRLHIATVMPAWPHGLHGHTDEPDAVRLAHDAVTLVTDGASGPSVASSTHQAAVVAPAGRRSGRAGSACADGSRTATADTSNAGSQACGTASHPCGNDCQPVPFAEMSPAEQAALSRGGGTAAGPVPGGQGAGARGLGAGGSSTAQSNSDGAARPAAASQPTEQVCDITRIGAFLARDDAACSPDSLARSSLRASGRPMMYVCYDEPKQHDMECRAPLKHRVSFTNQAWAAMAGFCPDLTRTTPLLGHMGATGAVLPMTHPDHALRLHADIVWDVMLHVPWGRYSMCLALPGGWTEVEVLLQYTYHASGCLHRLMWTCTKVGEVATVPFPGQYGPLLAALTSGRLPSLLRVMRMQCGDCLVFVGHEAKAALATGVGFEALMELVMQQAQPEHAGTLHQASSGGADSPTSSAMGLGSGAGQSGVDGWPGQLDSSRQRSLSSASLASIGSLGSLGELLGTGRHGGGAGHVPLAISGPDGIGAGPGAGRGSPGLLGWSSSPFAGLGSYGDASGMPAAAAFGPGAAAGGAAPPWSSGLAWGQSASAASGSMESTATGTDSEAGADGDVNDAASVLSFDMAHLSHAGVTAAPPPAVTANSVSIDHHAAVAVR